MKKILPLAFAAACALSLTSCGISQDLASNQNQNQTSVVLSQNNFRIVGQSSASVKGVYVFGFGNLRKKALEKNAIDEMIRKANLTGSQAVTNITVKRGIKMITPIYVEVTMTATGNIVEFTK